ncbi:hypothetical protein [Halothiobacillus sp.]|uniref:hypothetical protein n=1 Tax=Halothiobacillus sp. TaxID=1891311 RepID=UPI002AD329DE|nr:hypothetical protein [Halothiobacillus sp.]
MTEFVRLELPESVRGLTEPEPVKVTRPVQWAGHYKSLFELRSNLLSIWPERAYRGCIFAVQLLSQHYFVCNSSDTVKRVFLEERDSYDRNSPQIRHALELQLGHGLFVSGVSRKSLAGCGAISPCSWGRVSGHNWLIGPGRVGVSRAARARIMWRPALPRCVTLARPSHRAEA